jgi:hypothetical protein
LFDDLTYGTEEGTLKEAIMRTDCRKLVELGTIVENSVPGQGRQESPLRQCTSGGPGCRLLGRRDKN